MTKRDRYNRKLARAVARMFERAARDLRAAGLYRAGDAWADTAGVIRAVRNIPSKGN